MLDVLAGDTKRNKPLASRSHCTRIDSPAPEKIVDVSDLVVNWKNPNLDIVDRAREVEKRWRIQDGAGAGAEAVVEELRKT